VKPKILLIDFETLPNLGYTWRKYDQNVIDFKQEYCLATFAGKWLGDGKIFAKGLPDYRGYRAGSYDDSKLVLEVHGLLDEADIVIAHNGDTFDIKVANSRMLASGLMPPSPYKTIDTKKMAKRIGLFNSNKLDDLARYFGLGRKIDTTFKLWLDCIKGDRVAWAKMIKYNKHDIRLLEAVYLKLLPYIAKGPNLGVYIGAAVCRNCGSSQLRERGYQVTQTHRYKRFQCQKCGSWSQSAVNSERMTTIK
jgi:RNase_H superfamily